ncbi:MAG: hypothetical protein ABL993_04870 [Vicinamibacterales bacterium]
MNTSEEYCRQVERYLCRKNDGHLVRIVGPAFEQVCGWAGRGIPFAVACGGIDRYFERYYAKGPRRRPVQIQFCEADVLDMFDEWRRAVGVTDGALHATAATSPTASDVLVDDGAGPRREASLPAHLERVVARLTVLRSGEDRSLDPAIDSVVRELDAARAGAARLRGSARERFVNRLRALDDQLLDAARAGCDDATLAQLGEEADADLAPFRNRMPRDAYDQSRTASIDRLLRERSRLPVIAFE